MAFLVSCRKEVKMKRPFRIVWIGVGVLVVASLLLVGLSWLPPRHPRPVPRQPSVRPEGGDGRGVAQTSPPMKWKLEFPRFFVPVEDLADRLGQADAPVCKGVVRFLGEWPSKPVEPGPDRIRVTARYGMNWDGFYIGYELTADAPASLHGRTRLSLNDLQEVRIRYTDDLLEAENRRGVPVDELIDQMRRLENRVQSYGTIIPGGEMLEFSPPLKALMFRGVVEQG